MGIASKFLLTRQEITQAKLRIKLKTTLFTTIAAVIFLSSLIGIVYFLGFNVLCDKAVESQQEMARTLAASVGSIVEKESEVLRLSLNTQPIIDALKQNNLKYDKKGEKEIQRYLMDMDKRWIESPDDHPILQEYLNNGVSLGLKEVIGQKEELAGIIIADKFGGLAGATARPSGFYSFDKDWWLDSYAKGKGKIYVGEVEYDEPANLWCLPFAAPIEDETGVVIGAGKTSVNINTFFGPLADFKVGKTGDAVLVDDRAFLLYHQKASPFANKFCDYEELQKILQGADKWGVLDTAYLNRGKKLAAYSQIDNALLSAKGNTWYVFVERDLREIFAPLYKLMFMMAVIGLMLTIILALSVFILSGQEPPNYSMLQVIKDTAAVKTEAIDHNPAEDRGKGLPKENK